MNDYLLPLYSLFFIAANLSAIKQGIILPSKHWQE